MFKSLTGGEIDEIKLQKNICKIFLRITKTYPGKLA